jgi:hypothetical protein
MSENNADNVALGTTGQFYWDRSGQATAPTDATSALAAAFAPLGFVSEDGVTWGAVRPAGDTTQVRAWQDAAVVRTIRTPAEDVPTFQVTFIETKLEVVELAWGVTVEQSATDGSFIVNNNAPATRGQAVLDVEDENGKIRIYGPRAVVTEVGDITFSNGEPIGYQITVEFEWDQALGGNQRVFMTQLAEAV